MKKKILVGLLAGVMMLGLVGCDQRQADDVSYNLSLRADNFEDVRQITVINCLQGDVLFQMTGKMSIEVDSSDNQLEIVVEDEVIETAEVEKFLKLIYNIISGDLDKNFNLGDINYFLLYTLQV